jgi:hypothetical protein
MAVIFTALCLAATYGWLAGFVRQSNGNLAFQWHWQILLWALIGFVTTVYFWRKIWPPANQRDTTSKDIVLGTVVLAVPGLWWLIFPLRSLSGQHFWDVTKGLVAAALVLSFGAWMVVRLGKGFENDEAAVRPPGANRDEDPKP